MEHVWKHHVMDDIIWKTQYVQMTQEQLTVTHHEHHHEQQQS